MATMDTVLTHIKALLVLVLGTLVFSLESLVKALAPKSLFRRDIKGDIVLITGGGSGIGRCVARGLASKGAKIVSWDINEKGNAETAKLIEKEGGKCFTYTVDITNKDEIYKTAEKVKTQVGKVDILINNAGVVTGRGLLECPDEKILLTFNVNVISHFWTLKAFLPAMKKDNSGHVVTIASLAGIFGVNKLTDYCSSKFAAVGLDESLRYELQDEGYTGIKTTVVCPHHINTGMFDGAGQSEKFIPILKQEEVGEEIVDAILMGTKLLVLPSMCNSLVALKWLLPLKTGEMLAKTTGTNKFMTGFVGRTKSD